MRIYTRLIVALGAAGIAIAAPALAQDVHRDTPTRAGDMATHQDRDLQRHDMPGMRGDDQRAARADVVRHDMPGMRGSEWNNGRRTWGHHRHCRWVWRHHHRVRRCWYR